MNEKILVTIANYNHSHFLSDSIKSIINQTYKNLDICVIDDMSNDQEKVSKIVNSFKDSRIRYIKNNKNMGKWWCLNEAIKNTDAIICTSHDADDISLPDRIEKQYLTLKKTNTIHNLCSFYHCFNEKELLLKWVEVMKEENPDYYKGFNPYDYIGKYEVKYFGYLRFDTPEVSLTGNEMT